MLQGNRLVVLRRNPFAVVGDFYRIKTLILETDLDGSGTSVQTILDKFFDDRIEVDDDLARLDLMDLFNLSISAIQLLFYFATVGKRTVLDSMALIVALDAILRDSPALP